MQAGKPTQAGKPMQAMQSIRSVCLYLAGWTAEEVAKEDGVTFVQHYRGLYKLYDITGQKRVRDFKTQVTVLCGAPATGKSRLAAQIAAEYSSMYYKTLGEWWDNMPPVTVRLLMTFMVG